MKKYTIHANSSKQKVTASTRIVAAEEDDYNEPAPMDFDDLDDDTEGLADTVEDVSDTVDDIKDSLDDNEDKEDDINIDIENNISGHYIAECEKCKGIFISATVKSDQEVTSVTGECPLCGEETTQYLKWVIEPTDM